MKLVKNAQKRFIRQSPEISRFWPQPEWSFPTPNSAGNHIGAPIGIPIIATMVMKKPKINLKKNLGRIDMAFLLSYCLLFPAWKRNQHHTLHVSPLMAVLPLKKVPASVDTACSASYNICLISLQLLMISSMISSNLEFSLTPSCRSVLSECGRFLSSFKFILSLK